MNKAQLINEKLNTKINLLAMAVAFISLLVSFGALYLSYFDTGQLIIHEPTGFCIVRGYQDVGFRSDHLIIPFVIENTGKGVKIFQAPILTLENKKDNITQTYKLAGTIPDLYRTKLDKSYEIGFSVPVPENSVGGYKLVFHIENWWDTTKPDYSEFHFKSGQEWFVSLSYLTNDNPAIWQKGDNKNLFTMPIYPTIDRMTYEGGYNSDCFSLKYDSER